MPLLFLQHARSHHHCIITFQALSKEDIASIKSCLQRVKRHREVTSISTSTLSTDPSTLKANLARAKELAAKVHRRKEGQDDESQQHDADARDR